MKKNKGKELIYRSATAKRKDDVICYVVVEVVSCR